MGSTSDAQNSSLSSNALPQPALLSALSDEDEPPSSSGPGLVSSRNDRDLELGVASPIEERDITTQSIRTELRCACLSQDSEDNIAQNRGTVLGSRISTLTDAPLPQESHCNPRVTYTGSLRAILAHSYLNVLLIFIPISWALHFAHQNETIVFILSCFAIVPLAALLGFGTEQIALRTTQSIGGLLNATLGNVIELIIAVIAIQKCELGLAQSALLGGLLSNLLLVLGMAFIIGGTRYPDQNFLPLAAQLNSSLLVVAVISLVVPAAFHQYLGGSFTPEAEGAVLLKLSRGSAVILILIYVAYMVFQFHSHKHIFRSEGIKTLLTPLTPPSTPTEKSPPVPLTAHDRPAPPSAREIPREHERPRLNAPSALAILVISTTLAYFTAENLVDALEGLVAAHNISKEWLALIVIPIVGNAAEHATAIVVARKGKFDLVLGVAVGSCIQIALFVIPVLVLVAWGVGKPLTLLFDPLETICLFLSVLLVKFSLEDGKAHWMSGVVLVAVYVLIALSFWFFPTSTMGTLQGKTLTCAL